MLEYNRFPPKYDFLERENLSGSLYAVLKKHGIVPSRAVHDISLGHATPLVSKYLGTSPGEALLILDEIVFDQQEQPLHTSRQWIRGDKYTFRI
jgi:GntR family transcriptional regulator